MTPPPEAREAAVCANPVCRCGHDAKAHMDFVQTADCLRCDCKAFQPAPAAPQPAAPPTWFCNKCGKVGEAATRDAAQKQHAIQSPRCDYLPAWNWKPAPVAAAPSGARETDYYVTLRELLADYDRATTEWQATGVWFGHDAAMALRALLRGTP
jgi:hypothetical protein